MSNGGFGGVHAKLLDALARPVRRRGERGRSAPDARRTRRSRTCSTCTAFARRRSRPRRARSRPGSRAHRPRAALVVPAAAGLAARGDGAGHAPAIADWPRERMAVIGSSLGGFYATVRGRAHRLPRRAAQPGRRSGARPGAPHRRDRPPGTTRASASSFAPSTSTSCARSSRRRRHAARALLRGHRQGRRGARLARDGGALRRRAHQAARGQRPRAVGLRRAPRRTCWRFLELAPRLSGTAHGDNRAHVCTVRRSRQVPRRPRDVRGRQPRRRSSSTRGKRVKVKAANVLLKFEKPAAGRADRARRRRSPHEIDLDLAWEFAPEDEFGFADLARDYFERQGRRRAAGRRAAAPVRGAALLPPPRQGRFRKAPEEIVKAALLGIERKKQVAAQIDAWAGELGARRLPGADPRAALQASCSSPTRTRPNTRRWSRPSRALAARAARAAEGGRRDRLALPVPLAALPVRELPEGHRLPAARGAGDQATSCRWPPVAGVLDRRLGDDRDRRRALGAGPRQRHGHGRHPHRRAGARARARQRRSTRSRASACRPSTCRATRSRCCPTTWSQAYTLPEGRDCPAVSLYVTLRRGDAGAAGTRDAARARADRRQPAPRPARRA